MKKAKHILITALWAGLVIGVIISLGFSNKEQDLLTCKSIDVSINQDDELYFLDNDDVIKFIRDKGDTIVNQPKSVINTNEIEKKLNSHNDIDNAEVYLTIDGKLKVNVKQRKPIVRVFIDNGDSYYIDSKGDLMDLSKYTVKVLVANGNISDTDVKNLNSLKKNKEASDVLKSRNILNELYIVSKYIMEDEFWKAQVQQIYINDENDFEFVPMAGNHKIIFGDTVAMDEKFKKLLVFYQQGLNTTGWWDKYEVINLKFKNQIVCTKKK